MRPKDLKFPSTWNQQRPLLHEGVLIIPKCFGKHGDFCLKSEMDFSCPVSVEYCSGNGDWVIEQAKLKPSHFWIAVEKQFKRVKKIWSKMRNHQIENLLIVCGDALTLTLAYLWENAAEEIFVNFPDPWPKPRHAKHRLIQKPFVDAVSSLVLQGGRAVYATDHHPYALQMIEEMEEHQSWKSVFPKPFFIQEWEGYGRSWFGDLFEKKGKQTYFIQYQAL
jgi:tRNA (guanine-N7-)-methyltransferase